MEISSASTLKGFAVIRREGVNPQPAGAEGIDGIKTGLNNAIADVIDISTEGRSFANQEENNRHSEGQGRSPLFGSNPQKPDNPELTNQQSEVSSGGTITAAVLTGSPEDEVSLLGQIAEDGNQAVPTEQRQSSAAVGTGIGQELTDEEKQIVNELKRRDAEVRAHEHAHLAAAGQFASGGIHFEYQKGPDGRQYAVGGEVSISMPSGSTPEESLRIARQVERAANAPASPSSAGRAIAAAARAKASEALREMSAEAMEKSRTNREAVLSNGEETKIASENPNIQEIPINGIGQPQIDGEGNIRSGQTSVSEFNLIGEDNQTDSVDNQTISMTINTTQGNSTNREPNRQSDEDEYPELIDLVNNLDRRDPSNDKDTFGEVSDVLQSELAVTVESRESLLSLVDSL